MVDFGSEQGLSDFETAGIARYSEDSACGFTACSKERKRRSGPKDAVYGWTLVSRYQQAHPHRPLCHFYDYRIVTYGETILYLNFSTLYYSKNNNWL